MSKNLKEIFRATTENPIQKYKLPKENFIQVSGSNGFCLVDGSRIETRFISSIDSLTVDVFVGKKRVASAHVNDFTAINPQVILYEEIETVPSCLGVNYLLKIIN